MTYFVSELCEIMVTLTFNLLILELLCLSFLKPDLLILKCHCRVMLSRSVRDRRSRRWCLCSPILVAQRGPSHLLRLHCVNTKQERLRQYSSYSHSFRSNLESLTSRTTSYSPRRSRTDAYSTNRLVRQTSTTYIRFNIHCVSKREHQNHGNNSVKA